MKKVLSLVLTFVMVAAAFAMLVPTASAAAVAKVFYENDFSTADANLTDAALADAIFGAGNHNAAAQGTKLSIVNGALKIDTTAGKTDFFNMVLSTDADISEGYYAEMDYTFSQWDAGSTQINGRFVSFSSHEATKNNWNDMTIVGPYSAGINTTSPNARCGSRPGSAWKGWTSNYGTPDNVNTWETTYRMRASILKEKATLEVAKYTEGVLGEYVMIASTTDVYPAQTMKDLLTLCIQKQNVVTIDNIRVTGLEAKFPEDPAVTTSAGKVLYTQDFSNAAYAGKTDVELADAIFGAGNHNAEAQKTKLSLVDGALKVDTTARGTDFFHALLVDDAVISEGYVAEMDYTFQLGEFASALNGRFISFSTHGNVTQENWTNLTIVGPYSPTVGGATGNPNARVATRPGGTWNGWTSTYGTPANVNTLGETYRMRATITKDTLKLEVAKYTAGVLGDYVEIATAAHGTPSKTLGDYLTLCVQHQDVVTIDNIQVTSLTSTPVNSFAGYQLGANQIRLVGLLDTVTYTNATAVGFKVAILGKGEFKDLECNYVYESIDSDTAASLNAGYDYLYAMHITEIPAGEYSFKVVPYYVVGGETVYGAAKTFAVNIANAQ